MRDGRSLAAIGILAIVGVLAGGLLAIIAFAHVAGRTTVERPPRHAGGNGRG